MTFIELENIRIWFYNYVAPFLHASKKTILMIQMKLKHSQNVAENCRMLAEELKWPENEVLSGEALGLLHDVGRFSQYTEYGTFVDSYSFDHGKYGCDVVYRSNILSSVAPPLRQSILDGIHYHSYRDIPPYVSPESLRFLKMVRDSDKLDILQVIDDSIKNNDHKEHLMMALNIKSDGPINGKVLDEIRNNRVVSNKHIQSLMDFYLMQLSWVFDINYCETFIHIIDRRIYDRIIRVLNDYRETQPVIESIFSYLKTRVSMQ